MRTKSAITEKKIGQKSMATFLANEMHVTTKDVMGPAEQVQIMFPLKIKKYQLMMQGI